MFCIVFRSYIVFAGDLNCPTCTLIRGALVGVVGGGIYPILLALPVNAGLAARLVLIVTTHCLIEFGKLNMTDCN